jgi:hypothetical protein
MQTKPAPWEVHGTLAAPATAVARLLFTVAEGRVGDDNLLVLARASAARRGAMTVVEAGAGAYRAELAGLLEPVVIQRGRARLAVRTWYAGVYAVTACPAGTRIIHRVDRVLPEHPGFADGIAELGLRARMVRDMRQVIGVIADRLGC